MKHKKCTLYNNIQNIAVTFVVTIFVLRGNKEPNCSIVNLLRFESFFFLWSLSNVQLEQKCKESFYYKTNLPKNT